MDQLINKKATSGILWTTIQKFASIGLSFISGIILARLLSPADYGTIGVLTIFIMVSEAFIDGGFGSALIQKKRPTQDDYSTIFWWNLTMAFFLYIILFISAPYIALYFRNEILCPVLRVQSLTLLILAFNTIQYNQLKKKFQFKSLALVTLVSSFIALIITIILAILGFGVWALVVQGLINALIPTFYYWFKSKWKPSLTFSVDSFKQLASFGIFIFLTKSINEICNNIQGILIGRYFNASAMGFYSKAKGTEKLASTSISSALNQVTYPIYAELQDNIPALINMIKKIVLMIAFITFPLMYLLMIEANEIFVLLYSDKWLESVPYFQILCFAGAAQCLQAATLQPVNAIGKSKTTFTWNLLKRIIGLSLVIGGFILYGIEGLLIGMVFNSWILYFINAFMVSKYIGYGLSDQFKDLFPILFVSIITLCVTCIVGTQLTFSLYVNGIIKLVVFCAIYYLLVRLLKLKAYDSFMSLLPIVFSKIKRT